MGFNGWKSGLLGLSVAIALVIATPFVGSSWAQPVEDETSIFEFENRPTFETEATGPVLLRYQFEPGQQWAIEFDMDMTMDIQAAAMNMEMTMDMGMSGGYTVETVDADGNGSITMTITRVTMDMGGPMAIRFDSDDPSTITPEFTPMLAMLNVPLRSQISPMGELVSADMGLLYEALQTANIPDVQSVEDMTEQLMQNSFILLAADPVNVGDVYDAGSFSLASQATGAMEASASYEVIAISGDLNQVLLRPIAEIEFDLASMGIPGEVETSDLDGWLLFDVGRGNVTESEVGVGMVMTSTDGGEQVNIDMTIMVHYQANEIQETAPDPEPIPEEPANE